MRKLSYEEVKEYIESFGYKLLSEEYKNNRTKLCLQCPEGHIFEIRYSDFKNGVRCKTCSYKNNGDYFRFTYEYVKKYIENEGYNLLSTEYINANSYIEIVCPKGHKYKTKFGTFKNGNRCRECYFIYENNKTTIHSYEYVKNKMLLEGYELLSTEYINAHTKLQVRCSNGHIYETTWNSFQQGSRCPHCNESKGEREIRTILDNLNIKYISQYKFDDCKFKYVLPFDFYLSDYNCCIEFDGIQHFEIVEHFGGFDSFIDRIIRDTIKNEYCKNNNIKLIRISYKEIDKIENILIRELKLK